MYVVSISDDGTVFLGAEEETIVESFLVEDFNFQGQAPMQENEIIQCRVQIRYRHTPVNCEVLFKNGFLEVRLIESTSSVTPGQSAVFFPSDQKYILMGGIIKKGSIVQKKIYETAFAT